MSAAHNINGKSFFPQAMLSDVEKKQIFSLAEEITGTCQQGHMQKDVLVMNVMRRMRICGSATLSEYLEFIKIDAEEDSQFVSALTIHTTSWFREAPHYAILRERALEFVKNSISAKKAGTNFPKVFQVWCAACSTGEEVYSFGSVLEKVREEFSEFDYKILGTDIDIVSLNAAKKAIYAEENLKLSEVIPALRKFFLMGSGKTEGLFTIDANIRSRCVFQKINLSLTQFLRVKDPVHFLVCRNVLIYFDAPKVKEIVRALSANLCKEHGALCLGHSETVAAAEFSLLNFKNSVYVYQKNEVQNFLPEEITSKNIGLQKVPERLNSAPINSMPNSLSVMAKNAPNNEHPVFKNPEVILLGASTGGNEALIQLLQNFPQNSPPVVVVQHISAQFAQAFAERLARQSKLVLGNFQQGEVLQNGHLYMALSDNHICLKRVGANLVVSVSNEEPLLNHRPSVDKLFMSAAQAGARSLTFLLTGMGRDGAQGMLELHKKGSFCAAQSENSCVVFGMPKEAIKLGGVNFVGDLYMMRKLIEDTLKQNTRESLKV